MKRNVYIRHEPQHNTMLVVYAETPPKLHAQFDDRAMSLNQTIAYVRSNQILRLVCAINSFAAPCARRCAQSRRFVIQTPFPPLEQLEVISREAAARAPAKSFPGIHKLSDGPIGEQANNRRPPARSGDGR